MNNRLHAEKLIDDIIDIKCSKRYALRCSKCKEMFPASALKVIMFNGEVLLYCGPCRENAIKELEGK